MFNWFRNRKRKKILATPFPEAWKAFIQQNVAHYSRLGPAQQKRLLNLVHVFVSEKFWEGCGGLTLTDEIRVTIAAEACLLVLERPQHDYPDVESIFVYPTTTWRPNPRPGFFEVRTAPQPEGAALLGEAWRDGPVILAWDDVKRSARHPESGHNLVYHEFAHKLDMLNGRADGAPPLEGAELKRRWAEVCTREFRALQESAEKGKHSYLDPYGATNEAEFFAVVTEKFFDQPDSLRLHAPDLYDLFRAFYHQDPAQSLPSSSHT